MQGFTPISALVGGSLIGLAASLFLATTGRVAGISGIYGGILRRGTSDRRLRVFFVAGLVAAAIVVRLVRPEAFVSAWNPSLALALAAGVVVGVGTQLGNGCTSGHGVCGISRLSARSFIATATFVASAGITVFVTHHLLGGGR